MTRPDWFVILPVLSVSFREQPLILRETVQVYGGGYYDRF